MKAESPEESAPQEPGPQESGRSVEKEIQAIGAALGHARERLGAGELLDLSALDGRIGRLCTQIEALPTERAKGLRTRVMGLIDDLSLLARLIEVRLAGLRARLPQAGGPAS